MEFLTKPYMMAFWFGAFSALSLPLGAMLGIWLKPSSRIVSAVMAFGAGALLAALALELVGPAMERTGFVPVALGCLSGGSIFVLLNQAMSGSGAFLRKPATIVAHLKNKKREHIKGLVEKLSVVDVLRAMPPEEIQAIIPHIDERSFAAGSVIFSQDALADALFIVESGSVRIEKRGDNAGQIATLGPGQTFGEMALLHSSSRMASAVAVTDVTAWQMHKKDFEELLAASPKLRDAVTQLADSRERGVAAATQSAEQWQQVAMANIGEENFRPTNVEIKQAAHEHGGGAALAIWLGIFLDGIPESLVIGASMIGSAISPALIGGLFLANLPESMSSAVMMKRQGSRTGKIFWMWMSLMIITGIGALIGNLAFVGLPHSAHSFCEALAAGAMLAMIAQTMLPEAYEGGGWLVGILTVLGFVSAIFFQSLSPAG